MSEEKCDAKKIGLMQRLVWSPKADIFLILCQYMCALVAIYTFIQLLLQMFQGIQSEVANGQQIAEDIISTLIQFFFAGGGFVLFGRQRQ